MSTSAISCPKCGTRIATINKSGFIRTLGGVAVRLGPYNAELTCLCGETRKVRYPVVPKAA